MREDGTLTAIDGAAMLAQVEAWSAINTGTANLAGLARQAAVLAEAFEQHPGSVIYTGVEYVNEKLENGQRIEGESQIGHAPSPIVRLGCLPERPPALPRALEAIANADLIVLGAFGHSRAREWIFGGVTADLLRACPAPLGISRICTGAAGFIS